MKEKDTKVFAFRGPEDLFNKVQQKIDKENVKAKDRKDRTNLSRKIKELLYEYISK